MEDEDLPTRSCSTAHLCETWGLLDRSGMLEHRVALPGVPYLANGAEEQSGGLVAGGQGTQLQLGGGIVSHCHQG